MPTGSLSRPKLGVRELVAASATFRGWVAAATEAEALLRVHDVEVVGPEANREIDADPAAVTQDGDPREPAIRPFALVTEAQSGRVDTHGYAAGEFLLLFEAEIDPSAEPGAATQAFEDVVGAIVREMRLASLQGGRIMLAGLELHAPTTRSRRRQERFAQAWYTVRTGLGGGS